MKWVLSLLIVSVVLLPVTGVTAQTDIKGVVFSEPIGLQAYVRPLYIVGGTWDTQPLGNRVGWLSGTAWLNHTRWRIVLAGHTPGAFERLHELQIGDAITLTDMGIGISTTFYVTAIHVVDRFDVRWVMPTPMLTLTLITCQGDRRLVVEAQP